MDLNDAAKAGVNLADLLASAENEDHLLGRSWQDLVKHGLDAMESMVGRCRKAQDKIESARIVGETMRSEVIVRAMAIALLKRPTDMLSYQPETGSLLGQKAAGVLWRSLDDESGKVRALIERSESNHRATTLDALLRPTGVSGLRCPRGYLCDKDGVSLDDGKIVAPSPIVILSVGVDADTGQHNVEVAWCAGERWFRRIVDRRTVTDSRALLKLSDDYAPVNSVNASMVVKWLADFEAENSKKLLGGSVTMARRMGWVDDAFLIGTNAIGGNVMLHDPNGDTAGFRAHGDEKAWREAVVTFPPVAMALLYASACTPLLAILGAPGFVVDLSGETTKGKTTMFRVAASVWGRPDLYDDGIIKSWDSASVAGIMTRAWFNQSIPVMLDDTKRAKYADVMSTALYAVPGGQDRQRLDSNAEQRRVRTWRTVLLSTGEAAITSFDRNGGGNARSICISEQPLPDDSGAAARAIETKMLSTYGHCGPALVQWLIANKPRWDWLRELHAQMTAAHAGALGDGVADRVAGYVATMELAAHILHREMRYLPGDYDAGLGVLIRAAANSVEAADVPRAAADAMWAWITSNSGKFWDPGDGQRAEPQQGWVGRWNKASEDWDFVGIRAEVAAGLLDDWGFTPGDVFAAWRRRGYLRIDPTGKNPRCGPRGSRVMVLTRAALEGRQEA